MILVGGQLTQVGLICKFIFFLSYHVMMKLCKTVSKERLMIDCMLVEFSILACLVFFLYFLLFNKMYFNQSLFSSSRSEQ
jgi:hypothetical protein